VITRLRIHGFKGLSDHAFDLGALTILAGVNGCGKSSVLQSLALCAAVCRSRAPRVDLDGESGLELGEPVDVIHRGEESSDRIVFEVTDARDTHSIVLVPPTSRGLQMDVHERPDRPPKALRGGVRRFCYLGAERLGPRDILPATASGIDEIGSRGEHVAQVLVSHASAVVRTELVHPETRPRGAATNLRAQVELWLSKVVGEIQVESSWGHGSNMTMVRFRRPGFHSEWLRPANAGFGVTYSLPIVVAGLLLEPGALLLIENPEAHLHPRAQSEIARFLVAVAASGVQVVVETHSDHIFNGVRRTVAVDQPGLGADQVSLYAFLESAMSRVACERIGLRPDGSLDSWPKSFFDQIETDLGAIARRTVSERG
jgi:predicted ATPase